MQLPAMEYKLHLKEWFYYVACISELETRWLSSHSCYYCLKSAWSPDQGCVSVFSQTNYETHTGIRAGPLWSPHHPYYVQTMASPQLWMYCTLQYKASVVIGRWINKIELNWTEPFVPVQRIPAPTGIISWMIVISTQTKPPSTKPKQETKKLLSKKKEK